MTSLKQNSSIHIALKVHPPLKGSCPSGELPLPCPLYPAKGLFCPLYPSNLFTPPLLLPSRFVLETYTPLRTMLRKGKNTSLPFLTSVSHHMVPLFFWIASGLISPHPPSPASRFPALISSCVPDTCSCFSDGHTPPDPSLGAAENRGQDGLVHSSGFPCPRGLEGLSRASWECDVVGLDCDG